MSIGKIFLSRFNSPTFLAHAVLSQNTRSFSCLIKPYTSQPVLTIFCVGFSSWLPLHSRFQSVVYSICSYSNRSFPHTGKVALLPLYPRLIKLWPVLAWGHLHYFYSCQTCGKINRQGLHLFYPHTSWLLLSISWSVRLFANLFHHCSSHFSPSHINRASSD